MTLVHFSLRPLAFICLMLCLGHVAIAQDDGGDTAPADTTEIVWRNKRYIIIKDEEGKRLEVRDINDDEPIADDYRDEDEDDRDDDDRNKRYKRSDVDLLGFDLGITNYFSQGQYGDNAITPELRVREFRPGSHVALHLLPTRVAFDRKGYVNLKTAITIDWNYYHYEGDLTLVDGEAGLTFDSTGTNFSKNNLMARYIQIPLMLNFDTDPGDNDGISISVGAFAGLLWAARTKQVSEEFGTVKLRGDFGLNPYRYGLIGRIDFKWFDIYLHYNLSTLFEEGQGPDTQTFVAGINLIDF